jgi:hypothetical protein
MAIANITGNILTDSGISTSSLLPLSGGTITGFLTSSKSITTGENGQISIIPSTNTSAAFLQVTNTDGTTYFGKNNNSGSYLSSLPNATLVYSTGSSPIMLYTNGNMIMTLTGGTPSVGGNVLINTTSDNGAKLQVSGAATFSSSVAVGTLSLSGGTIQSSGDYYIGTNNANFIQFYTSNQNRMIITSGGNVGIGTSSPSALLHAYSSTNNAEVSRFEGAYSSSNSVVLARFSRLGNLVSNVIRYADSKGLIEYGSTTGHDIGFITSDTERMRITSGGNVGIGTNSPSRKLVIVGGNGNQLELDNTGQTYTQQFFKINGTDVGTFYASNTEFGMYTYGSQFISLSTNNTERMRITSAGVINTTSRLNVNGAGDNSLFSLINNGTTYTLGFSPNASASTSTTLTITTATTTWIYNGTGTATWTLPNPSGTNQMFWIKNAGTGVLTLNAFSGTNIINNSATAVSSITIAVGATALIQQDGNVRSYQLQ